MTAQTVPSARTSERRDGPVREEAPHLTRSEEGQGRGAELFLVFEEEPGGSRPPCLGEPWGPQEKVQQRTVEQFADVAPMVQILDIPGPQGGDQLVEACWHLDLPIPEQVIEVPKISSSSRRSRRRRFPSARRRRNSWWKCRNSCRLPLCSSRSSLMVTVVGLVGEVFKFPPRNRIHQRLVESNTLTLQFRVVEVFKALALDRVQQRHPRTHIVLRMRFLHGGSRTFPRWVRTRGRN